MDQYIEYLPVIIPLVIIQIILSITAVIHVIRHPNYRFGKKQVWIPVVLFIGFIGPFIYFIFGRGDD